MAASFFLLTYALTIQDDYSTMLCRIVITYNTYKITEMKYFSPKTKPNDGWKTEIEFQSDCVAYTLFNNNIQATQGTNHWMPFTEQEVDAKEAFDSHGKPIDNRTPEQKDALTLLLHKLKQQFSDAKIIGHRDIWGSDSKKWKKWCPCFNAINEY